MKQLDNNTVIEIISYIEKQIDTFPQVYYEQGIFVPEEVSTGYVLGLGDLKQYLLSLIDKQ